MVSVICASFPAHSLNRRPHCGDRSRDGHDPAGRGWGNADQNQAAMDVKSLCRRIGFDYNRNIGFIPMTITRQMAFHGIRPLSCRMTNMQRNRSSTQSEPRERFFDNILNYIPDLIFVKDESHRWIYVNDAFCAALGHRREALIGKTDYDFHPKAEADIFWE